MTTNTGGAVVLLSGGMDSTVLLHFVARSLRRTPIHALSFNYGQRHTRELECGAWQARRVKTADHRTVDVSFLGELVREGTALVSGGADVPDLKDLGEDQLAQPPTYVPNRNMILLSIAAAYAEAMGIAEVFYGAQAHDEYGYWDCTREYLERLNGTLELNRGTAVQINAPFIDKKKSEVVVLGEELSVDFARTWSCYRGGDTPCETCPTCVERAKAFNEAGMADPLIPQR